CRPSCFALRHRLNRSSRISVNQACGKHSRHECGSYVREAVQEFQTDPRCALEQSEQITEFVAAVGADLCQCLRLEMASGLEPTSLATAIMRGAQYGCATKATAAQRVTEQRGICSRGKG